MAKSRLSQLQRLAIAPEQLNQGIIQLTPQQQHYLGRVLRLQMGDRIMILNGQGEWWLACLKNHTTAEILEPLTVQTELPAEVTLIIALPKTGFDDIVRSCTELGASCIIPVTSDRTLLNPSPSKLERWRRIALEAAEQSERQIIPSILDPIPFATALSSVPAPLAFLCEARGDLPHLIDYQKPIKTGNERKIAIATGPEGGWTEAEIALATASGFKTISLGRRILKAVTAPLVALSLVAGILESH